MLRRCPYPPVAGHRGAGATIAAFIAERQGHALFHLSLSDSSFAPAAIEHLHSAVESYDSSYARPRAIHLPDLVGAYFRSGDLDTAVTTGHEAVTAISTLSSKLAYAGLRIMDTVADPFGHKPEVAELREHIRAALTSA
jgi:hypothetical protein